MKQIIESISYPCFMQVNLPDKPVFGRAMKTYFVGQPVQFINNEISIVSSIAPSGGGGYAVTFEDGRLLVVNDHPELEVMYKSLEEAVDGNIQAEANTAGV